MRRVFSYLFTLESLEVGGIQRQLYEVCRSLIARGDRCAVACFRDEKNEMREIYEKSGIKVVTLNKKKLFDIKFISAYFTLLRRGKFHLVHAMTPQAAFWTALLLPFFSKTKFIISLLNVHQFSSFFERAIESFISARRADAVFVNSQAGATHYKNSIFAPPEIYMIYNGAHADLNGDREVLRKSIGITADEVSVVCVGRLEEVKRHKDAINALREVVSRGVNLKLFIIGDGRLRSDLESLVSKNKLHNSVIFLGNRFDVEKLLPAFDIFLLPSLSEGFPNVLLEAMSAGLACVATCVGGIPEAIEHKVSGLLVRPSAPAEIADALNLLSASAELRKKLGDAAQRKVHESFTMERMLEEMTSMYDDLLCPSKYQVAYILSQFPKISENFILREIVEMRMRRIKCCIYSLKPSLEKISQKDAVGIMKDVYYRPYFSLGIIFDSMIMMIKNPATYVVSFVRFMNLNKSYLTDLVKALAVWGKTVSFARLSSKFKLRHIHSNWATIPTACAAAVSDLTGIDFSFTGHAWDIYGHPSALKEKIRAAKFVTTCTNRNLLHLRSICDERDSQKIFLVRHFMNPPECEEEKMPEGKPIVLSVGTLQEYKGHDVLIKAAASLFKEGFDFEVRIIGGGALERELNNLILKLNLSGKVNMLGIQPQERVFEEMRKACIFALASVSKSGGEDNLPNVLVEASFLKKPCITSNLGSINEFIINGETGILIEPGKIGEFADGLKQLLSDDVLRRNLSEKAFKKAKELFDKDKNASVLEGLFRKSFGNIQ